MGVASTLFQLLFIYARANQRRELSPVSIRIKLKTWPVFGSSIDPAHKMCDGAPPLRRNKGARMGHPAFYSVKLKLAGCVASLGRCGGSGLVTGVSFPTTSK